MTSNEVEIAAGFQEQMRRIVCAREAFNKGENISVYLLGDEMAEVNSSASLAVENKLNEMLSRVTGQLAQKGVS